MEALLRFKANDRCHSIPPPFFVSSIHICPPETFLARRREGGRARPSNAAASAVSSPRRNKINPPVSSSARGRCCNPRPLLFAECGSWGTPSLLLQCVLRESVGTSKMDFPKEREEWGEQPPSLFTPRIKIFAGGTQLVISPFSSFLGMFRTCEQASLGHPSP